MALLYEGNSEYLFFSLQSNMTMAALKLNEVERALTGSTGLKRILFDCCWLVSRATVTGYLERCGIKIGRWDVCKPILSLVHIIVLL